MHRTISPIPVAHTRKATGATDPSEAATLAGRRNTPPPTVTLTMIAANPYVPITRRSESDCGSPAVVDEALSRVGVIRSGKMALARWTSSVVSSTRRPQPVCADYSTIVSDLDSLERHLVGRCAAV